MPPWVTIVSTIASHVVVSVLVGALIITGKIGVGDGLTILGAQIAALGGVGGVAALTGKSAVTTTPKAGNGGGPISSSPPNAAPK